MASQMLASVKGMSACTTPNEASASTTEASWGVSQQPRTRALCIIALAELVERGCIEVIVTTFSARRCDRIARAGIERRSRAVAWPCSQAPTESRACVPRDFNPYVSEERVARYVHTGHHG
jgi:hypothetical protein